MGSKRACSFLKILSIQTKVKDIKFSITDEGIHYAEAKRLHKAKPDQTVPLIDSLPYLKEWLEEHPMGNVPDSYIFISQGNNHVSKLTLDGLSSHYDYYKTRVFSKVA